MTLVATLSPALLATYLAYRQGRRQGRIDGLLLAQSVLTEAEASPIDPDVIHWQRRVSRLQ